MRTGPGKLRITRAFLCAALLAGCVGNIESRDANTHVYELSTPELRFLCSWMDQTIEDSREDDSDADGTTDEELCEPGAAQISEDASQCYEFRTSCVSEAEGASRYVAGKGCGKRQKAPPRACNATVAQIKSCFLARQQELIDAARAASCGDVRGSRLPGTGSTLVSCREVEPPCHSLFGKLGSSEMSLTMAPSAP